MDYACLRVAQHDLFSAGVGNLTVGFRLTGHGRPTLRGDIFASLVGAGGLQFGELLGFRRVQVKLGDTNRGQTLDDGRLRRYCCHFLGCTSRHPAAPVEANNHGEDNGGQTRRESFSWARLCPSARQNFPVWADFVRLWLPVRLFVSSDCQWAHVSRLRSLVESFASFYSSVSHGLKTGSGVRSSLIHLL